MLTNTATRYGALARFFHWSIALLILTDLALGVIGDRTPRTADTVAWLQTLYSAHKTIGITVLLLAVLRIIWAVTQPRPVPLHPERRAETLAAEVVHWALYGAIIIMPLSGWVMHASESGFAPIWWPLGQGLPFVPKSEAVAHAAGAVHSLAAWVIYATVAAHIGGALKHQIIDKDATLARMSHGRAAGNPEAHHGRAAPIVAAGLWLVVLGVALVTGDQAHDTTVTPVASPAQIASSVTGANWTVDTGNIRFQVAQMGANVEGEFADWSAQIAYEDQTGNGSVTVVIDTTTLTLGSVTDNAKGAEFFNVAAYSTATFEADIARTDGAHLATGTLTLAGVTVPVTLPFELAIEGDVATMSGEVVLDRRDFAMGTGYADESTVGFGVTVVVTLTATRAD
ncbi:cytochrome b/b6 domain-containing protein [Celeribacter marinus]|nr:cytochrome b/b6 domain-containing protein [Celeribacter marinus]SFK04918.1 Cytochrome b561 [Celeribacter marinus]